MYVCLRLLLVVICFNLFLLPCAGEGPRPPRIEKKQMPNDSPSTMRHAEVLTFPRSLRATHVYSPSSSGYTCRMVSRAVEPLYSATRSPSINNACKRNTHTSFNLCIYNANIFINNYFVIYFILLQNYLI
jgi:hypothetical protein